MEQKTIAPNELNLTSEEWHEVEREFYKRNLYHYRSHIAKARDIPFIEGWFQRELCKKIQKFWKDYQNGLRPVLLICTPPQFGKSFTVYDAICWMAGMNPALRFLYTSYSEMLGIRANTYIQRVMTHPEYHRLFPKTMINETNFTVSDKGQRNKTMLEFIGSQGSFRNTTVNGAITGEGLDIGIVDDPVKGRAEANSPSIRQKTWDWFLEDFFTRFDNNAALLVVGTRWHVDDPIGRMIDQGLVTDHAVYKAIAVEDEYYRKKGESLFPELKSDEYLAKRKESMTQARWDALYQASPSVEGSGMIKTNEFKIVEQLPHPIVSQVRSWDKAGTQDGGAKTAGVRIATLKDGSFAIIDSITGQWSAYNREQKIKQTAAIDGVGIPIIIEQEPGSGGKESAENTVKMLKGYNIKAIRATGDKAIRAEPYAAQIEAGNVYLVRGPWNKDFIDEHEGFPNSKFKDQVDAASAGFNFLAKPGRPTPKIVSL